jgi:ribosomal protein L7/L12
MKWYYEIGEGQQGPVDLSDLRVMLASGELQAHHKVWSKELSKWTAAGEVTALAETPEQGRNESSRSAELDTAMAALSAATQGAGGGVSKNTASAPSAPDDRGVQGPTDGPQQKQFDLILGDNHDSPDDTHEIANAVRDVLDIGLQEAMDMVARAPCVLIEGLGRADAYAVEQHVMGAGGDIKWVERSVPIDGGVKRPSARFVAAFDQDLFRDLVQVAADEERDASEDSSLEDDEESETEEEIGCLGWLGIIWICGLVFAGCMRLCAE